MSSGAKVTTLYARETTVGQLPSGPFNVLRRTSFGVKPTHNTTQSTEIGLDRMSEGNILTTTDVGGEVGTLFRYGALDLMWASCFGSDWNNDTLTVGDERITMALAKSFDDINVQGIALGQQVTQMQLTVPGDGQVTVNTTFAGTGWQDNKDGSFKPQVNDDDDNQNYMFKDVTLLTMDGKTLAGVACVETFNLTFANSTNTQRCIGSDNPGFPGAIIVGEFSVTGSVQMAWSPTSYDLWQHSKDLSTVAFQFTIGNAAGDYTFTIPAVQILGDWPDAGKNDIVQVTLNLTAAKQKPTITRKAVSRSTGGSSSSTASHDSQSGTTQAAA
ncbi:hypothetical protein LMG33818_000886 [Halomonadaceae bacterium LMG 33818]|uniref:phage tail tube protein n=1 Tax=Cernens ardua TaxID=3402176 RepID=UPI003EDC784E